MQTFWVSGRRFADDHDQAVRFIDQQQLTERMERSDFPKISGVFNEYCNKCICWHIRRNELTLGK